MPASVRSNRPSCAYGTTFAKLIAAKNHAIVPTKIVRSRRSGIMNCIIGGPPAWEMKLVNPDKADQNAPRRGSTGRAGPSQALAPSRSLAIANTIASIPISARIQRSSKLRNSAQPSAIPARPAGIAMRRIRRSMRARKVTRPIASSSMRIGSMIATACEGATAVAISGTPSAPTAPPKPAFDTPVRITAGTAAR